MKLTTKLMFAAVFGLLVTTPISIQFAERATAQASQQTPTQQQSQPSKPAATPVTYKYVAQPGDSYTLIARKAVQTYGKKVKANVTLAGIIFAETNLTQGAGSLQLAVGQKVEIPESTLQQWVEKAKALSPAQQAAWQQYVSSVDFNTDKVGQAK